MSNAVRLRYELHYYDQHTISLIRHYEFNEADIWF